MSFSAHIVAISIAAAIWAAPENAHSQTCVTWKDRTVVYPPGRSGHAMAHDSARGVTVMFGGVTAHDKLLGDTWEWDGQVWTLRSTTGPAARMGHAMTYDSDRGVALLFGGNATVGDPRSGTLSDTWEWDGTAWIQRQNNPFGLYRSPLAYDVHRGVGVIHGSRSSTGDSSATFEWNGSSWAFRTTLGQARYDQGLTYDPIRMVTVLFGGSTPSGPSNQTWEWNGTSWSEIVGTSPLFLFGPAMVFDSARGVIVLSGTAGGSGVFGTWERSGTQWTVKNGTSPSAYHAMAYHAPAQEVIRFGGTSDSYWPPSGGFDHTHAWNGNEWLLRDRSFDERELPSMTFDSTRGVVVLFGGQELPGGPKRDTWEWNGVVWNQRSVTGPWDSFGNAFVFNSITHESILFGQHAGNQPGDVWKWNGNAWSLWQGPGPAYSDFVTSAAFDSARGKVVYTKHSNEHQQTWEWDDQGWALRDIDGPPPREETRIAYDSHRGLIVLYGGKDSYGQSHQDTWEYDGTAWQFRTEDGPGLPYGGVHSELYFDSQENVTVLRQPRDNVTQHWEWNGSSWTHRYDHPKLSTFQSTIYDSQRNELVLVYPDQYRRSGTWVLETRNLIESDTDHDSIDDACDMCPTSVAWDNCR